MGFWVRKNAEDRVYIWPGKRLRVGFYALSGKSAEGWSFFPGLVRRLIVSFEPGKVRRLRVYGFQVSNTAEGQVLCLVL